MATPAAAQSIDIDQIYLGPQPCRILSGSGSPEGSVTASPCSMYLRTSDGQIWRKASGSGDTGWVTAGPSLPLTVSDGGTGRTTLTSNGVLYGLGTSAIGMTAQGGSHTVLTADGGAPAFSATPTVTSLTATDAVVTPAIQAPGHLTLAPAGDVVPAANYASSMGLDTRRWLSFHGGEMRVQTLVASEEIARIGGRELIADGTALTSPVGAGDSTITTKHNGLSTGDVLYLQTAGQVEYMRVTGLADTTITAEASSGNYAGSSPSSIAAGAYVVGGGRAIVMSIGYGGGCSGTSAIASVTDTAGNTYTRGARACDPGGAAVEVWVALNATATAANTTTVTFGAAPGAAEMRVQVFRNVATSSAIDASFDVVGSDSVTTSAFDLPASQSVIVAGMSGGAHWSHPMYTFVGTSVTNNALAYEVIFGAQVGQTAGVANTDGGTIVFAGVALRAATSDAGYVYTVDRDLDGSGANAWLAGDAVINTGTTGGALIDAYATSGVMGTTSGPTIAGIVRTGTDYDDLAPRWAVGNLDGLYGYSTSTYGAAFGVPSGAWLTVDPTNGVRIGYDGTTLTQIDASGNASFSGSLTSSAGTIGGWTLGASSLTATNIGLYSGAANTARVEVGSSSNAGGLNSCGSGSDIGVWLGSTHSGRATAPFQVTCAGAATMSNVDITGGQITLAPDPSNSWSAPSAYKFSTGFGEFGMSGYSNDSTRLKEISIWARNDDIATPSGFTRVDIRAGADGPNADYQAELSVVGNSLYGSFVSMAAATEISMSAGGRFVYLNSSGLDPVNNNQLSIGNSTNRLASVYSEAYYSGTTQGVTTTCAVNTFSVSDGLVTACTSASDVRLKRDIMPYAGGLSAIRQLRPIGYRYQPAAFPDLDPDQDVVTQHYTGFDAANLMRAIPDAVTTRDDGYLSIRDTMPIFAALVNAVRELADDVDKLKQETQK
ncbi:MAG: hypothetical protein ABS36_11090 [Acidobacteria bacterium SCN 69-37]|nr:MAG: hypothetical protein ABS36_11090 [Acidobacteria bacterium SCN 69-37]